MYYVADDAFNDRQEGQCVGCGVGNDDIVLHLATVYDERHAKAGSGTNSFAGTVDLAGNRARWKARTVYMMANNETIMKVRQAQVSGPEEPVEVEAADSTSDMASSPVTAEDTTVTSIID